MVVEEANSQVVGGSTSQRVVAERVRHVSSRAVARDLLLDHARTVDWASAQMRRATGPESAPGGVIEWIARRVGTAIGVRRVAGSTDEVRSIEAIRAHGRTAVAAAQQAAGSLAPGRNDAIEQVYTQLVAGLARGLGEAVNGCDRRLVGCTGGQRISLLGGDIEPGDWGCYAAAVQRWQIDRGGTEVEGAELLSAGQTISALVLQELYVGRRGRSASARRSASR